MKSNRSESEEKDGISSMKFVSQNNVSLPLNNKQESISSNNNVQIKRGKELASLGDIY